jgi:hypothetical protein
MFSMNKEHRKSKRLKVSDGIANTPAGVCRIIDLNLEGLSIECVREWSFSQEWFLDIYATTGVSIEQLQVKIIWEKHSSSPGTPFNFLIKIGVAFRNLSYLQKAKLDSYIWRLDSC